MISNLRLKNFKALSDFEADLNLKKNHANPLVLIYGGNGAGKTTFAEAVEFLQESITSPVLRRINVRSSDLEKKDNRQHNLFEKPFNYSVKNSLFDEFKTAGSRSNLEFSIEFTLRKKRGKYKLVLNDEGVVYERLDFTLNKRISRIFEVSENDDYFSSSLFLDRFFKEKSQSEIKRTFGNSTVLSYLYKTTQESKINTLNKYVNPEVIDVLLYFCSIRLYFNTMDYRESSLLTTFGATKEIGLYAGKIAKEDEKYLKNNEKVLNYIFRKLYPDIDKVYYRKNIEGDYIYYDLYLKKMIGKSLREISFMAESTGTKKILAILPYLLDAVNGETVFIDEFDSGFHDLMADELLRDIERQINGQLIVTTHDTLFMKTVNPKHIYLLNSDSEGTRELIPLTDYMIQNGYNIQDRYLRGEYDAIPYPGTIDFSRVTEIMNGEAE